MQATAVIEARPIERDIAPIRRVQYEAVEPSRNEEKVGAALRVTRNCTMGIYADGVVTQAGLHKLILYIELIKDSFPKDEAEALSELSKGASNAPT